MTRLSIQVLAMACLVAIALVTAQKSKKYKNNRSIDAELKDINSLDMEKYRGSNALDLDEYRTALLRGVGRSRNFRGEIAENDHPQLAEYDIMEVEPVEGTPVDLPAPGEKSAEPTSKVARLRAGPVQSFGQRGAGPSRRRGNGVGRRRGGQATRNKTRNQTRSRAGNSRPRSRANAGSQRKGNKKARRQRRTKRNAVIAQNRYWPGKILPYSFPAANFTDAQKAVFAEAVADYSKYTCITLKERTDEINYVTIKSTGGCWSYIGRNYWVAGPQTLSLGPYCLNRKKTAIHEFMHALGVYHQHTRSDRDTYITVHEENIAEGGERNFIKKTTTGADLHNLPYSYESVMHYGESYFAKSYDLKTITTVDPTKGDIIGKAPTFAFEDVQLLSKIYNCNENCGPANCPAGAFQGKDCHCYCKSNDPDDPVYQCGAVCVMSDQECACTSRTDACSGVPHSTCSPGSQSCECDSAGGYVSHEGECVLSSSIQCTVLDVDCKCSLNSGSCNNADSNSDCDSASNKCHCKSGFEANENGVCVNINQDTCDSADKPCFCEVKGSSACSSVPNSQCDSDTGSCKCSPNFYNNGGICAAAPACNTLGSPCHCSVQDSNVCTSIPDTICDSTSDACECDPATHREEGGVCVFADRYHVDGSSVSPLVHTAASTHNFVPTSGPDYDDTTIPSNNMYLYAEGTGKSQEAELETVWLTSPGTWCLKFAVRWGNAEVYTKYEYESGKSGYSFTHSYDGTRTAYKQRSLTKLVSAGEKLKYKIRVKPFSDAGWHAAVDAVRVYKC